MSWGGCGRRDFALPIPFHSARSKIILVGEGTIGGERYVEMIDMIPIAAILTARRRHGLWQTLTVFGLAGMAIFSLGVEAQMG
jgi:hypothetical protein